MMMDQLKADILLTKIVVNINANIVEDMYNFKEYASNLLTIREVRNYRPLQRPITIEPKPTDSSKLKRKRLLIVRDWFFYVIWSTRLKEAAHAICERENKLSNDQLKFKKLFRKLVERGKMMKRSRKWDNTNSKDIDDAIKIIQKKIKLDEKSAYSCNGQITFRCQSVGLQMFSNNQNTQCINSQRKPIIEFQSTVLLYYIVEFMFSCQIT